jgi:hypothetical protein
VDKFPSREREAALALEPRVSAIVVVRNIQSLSAQHALDLSLRAALAEPWIDDLVIVDAGNAPEISSILRALHMDRRDTKLVASPAVEYRTIALIGSRKSQRLYERPLYETNASRWSGASVGIIWAARSSIGSRLARLTSPLGLAFDNSGNLLIADGGDARGARETRTHANSARHL